LKEFVRCLRHLFYGAIEGEFIGPGGLCEATEFSDELQRRRANFFVRRRWFEVVQGLNVSTHSIYSQSNAETESAERSTQKIHRRKKLEKRWYRWVPVQFEIQSHGRDSYENRATWRFYAFGVKAGSVARSQFYPNTGFLS
jgi:hypothetical protein